MVQCNVYTRSIVYIYLSIIILLLIALIWTSHGRRNERANKGGVDIHTAER